MRILRSVLISAVLTLLLAACQKGDQVIIDEPVINDPVVDPVDLPEVADPADEEEDEISACLMESIVVRGNSKIILDFTIDSVLSKVTLRSIDDSDIVGTMTQSGSRPSRFNWSTADGKSLGKTNFDRNGMPSEQFFISTDGTKIIKRTFSFRGTQLVKMEEENKANGDRTVAKISYGSDGQMKEMEVTKNGRFRPDKSKKFLSFDNNPNPMAGLGLLLLDFPEFRTDNFLPMPNNPLLIDDGIKGETKYEYQYNEIGMPVETQFIFSLNDREIINKVSIDLDCI